MSKIISISIDENTLKLLDDEAEIENRSRSNFLVGLFKKYIAEKRNTEIKEIFEL